MEPWSKIVEDAEREVARREPHTLLTLAAAIGRAAALEHATGDDPELLAGIASALDQFGRTVDALTEGIAALDALDDQRQVEHREAMDALSNRIESVTRVLQSHLGHEPTGEL